MNSILSSALPIPISQDAYRFAKQFAMEQATPEKGKQVYLNTLSVMAVRDYFQWLEISTKIDQGDCWHPVKRAMFNVADLVLPHLGKLECIPILPDQNDLEIPTEVADQRLGYIAVQLGEELKQVELLGFVSAQKTSHPPEVIPLQKLDSLDDLIETLNWHRQWANLWKHLSQPEWQPIELLPISSTRHLKTVTRQEINVHKFEPVKQSFSRGKVIKWDSQINSALLLTIQVSKSSTPEIALKMRLYSEQENIYLPSGLEVTVFDEAGVACMNAKAREADRWLELEFGCQPQEQFSLQIVVEQHKIIESFRV